MINLRTGGTATSTFKQYLGGFVVLTALVVAGLALADRNPSGLMLGGWERWEPTAHEAGPAVDPKAKAEEIKALLPDSDGGYAHASTQSQSSATESGQDSTSIERSTTRNGAGKDRPRGKSGGGGSTSGGSPASPSPSPAEPTPTQSPTEPGPSPSPTEPEPSPSPSPSSDPVADAVKVAEGAKGQAEDALEEAISKVPEPGPLPITPPSTGDIEELVMRTIGDALGLVLDTIDDLVIQPLLDQIEWATTEIEIISNEIEDRLEQAKADAEEKKRGTEAAAGEVIGQLPGGEDVAGAVGTVTSTATPIAEGAVDEAVAAKKDGEDRAAAAKAEAEGEAADLLEMVPGEDDLPGQEDAQEAVDLVTSTVSPEIETLISLINENVLEPVLGALGWLQEQLGSLIPDEDDVEAMRSEVEGAIGDGAYLVTSTVTDAVSNGQEQAQPYIDTVTATVTGAPGAADEAVKEAERQAKPHLDNLSGEAEHVREEIQNLTSNPELVAVAAVNSASAEGTAIPVFYGNSYTFKLSGTYRWAFGVNGANVDLLADAECSTGPDDASWVEKRYPDAANGLGPDGLDVYFAPTRQDGTVVAEELTWMPIEGSGSCSPSHTYVLQWTNDVRDGVVLFKVNDAVDNNVGVLALEVRQKVQSPQESGILGRWGTILLIVFVLIQLMGRKTYQRKNSFI